MCKPKAESLLYAEAPPNFMEQSDIKPKTENFQFSTSLVTLDFIGAVLGIIYILLEYRASIWLWIVSIIMPLVDMMLYFRAGLYADFGMAVYYALAAIYGYAMWRWKKKGKVNVNDNGNFRKYDQNVQPDVAPAESAENIGSSKKINEVNINENEGKLPITHFPRRLVLPTIVVLLALWFAIYEVLIHFTDSSVPITDSFTSALSIVALWALAHKYAEQWLLWIVVDAISSTLYVYKGIPFKASLYGLYVVIAIFGYRRWRQMAKENDNDKR